MILSKRMTAKSREANPEIQASKSTVKVMRELRPAALVNVEDFICFIVGFLSGNMTFLVFAIVLEDDDDVDDCGGNDCCDEDVGDDLFGSMLVVSACTDVVVT